MSGATSLDVLRDLSDLLKEQYLPGIIDDIHSMGEGTNRRVQRSKERVTSDGLTIRFEFARGDTVRSMSHANLDGWTHAHPFQADKIKLRYSKHEGGTNDFTFFEGQARLDLPTFWDDDTDAVGLSVVKRMANEMMTDYSFKTAMRRVTPRSGLLASVMGTVYSDSGQVRYNTGAGAASNANGARFRIDGGSAALFRRGMRLDIKTPSGAFLAQNVEIRHVNTGDGGAGTASIGVSFISGSADVYNSSGDLANVVDNAEIYHRSTFNAGMYGEEAWFSRPTSGESFIGGIDRTASDRRFMVIQAIREGQSTATLQRAHFAEAARAMNYRMEEEQVVAVVTDPTMFDSISAMIEASTVIPLETTRSNAKRYMSFGSNGVWFQHPHFGTTALVSDPMVKPNTVRIMTPKDWNSYYVHKDGIFVLPGGEFGNFHIVNSSEPGGGASKHIAMYTQLPGVCDVCLRPENQCDILNVTAA